MARFDVYHYNDDTVPFVVEVQADLLADLKTCVVVPLVLESNAKNEILPRLKPVIQIDDKRFIFMSTDIGTITRDSLGDYVTNIEEPYRPVITEALDFLFQGF